jgi:polysaccharide export outer membrane protein
MGTMKLLKSIALLSLCLTGAVTASAQDLTGVSSDTPLGPRDVVEIKVAQDPTANTRATIGEDGRINMPYLNKVDAAGLTPTQLEMRIKTGLEAKVLTRADVSVQVIEFGSKPISVIGAVNRPGRIGVTGNITLLQAITSAGGLAPGYGKTLYVLRTASNGLSEQIPIDIDDLMVTFNPDMNLPLAPNDVINVPVDSTITVYILGEVVRPGPVVFRRSQSPGLLQALSGAGGLTDRASRTVVVKRKDPRGKETTIKVDYKRIVSGRLSDVTLQDNDTVYVRESVF